MKAPKTKHEAQTFLQSASPNWKAFWFHDGPVVADLTQLATALTEVDDQTFAHHVAQEDNQLAAWVESVIGDQALARHLRRVRRRKTAASAVARRVDQLKRSLD